ncbi:MAG: hypothetical protein AMXMBFR56_57000 [Polyangiaceae bacterium]
MALVLDTELEQALEELVRRLRTRARRPSVGVHVPWQPAPGRHAAKPHEVRELFSTAGASRAAHWRGVLERARALEHAAGIELLQRERHKECDRLRRALPRAPVLFHGSDPEAAIPAAIVVLASLWDDDRTQVAQARDRILATLWRLATGTTFSEPRERLSDSESVGAIVRFFDEVERRSPAASAAIQRLARQFAKSERETGREVPILTAEELVPLRNDARQVARYLLGGTPLGSRPPPYGDSVESLDRDLILAHFAWRNLNRNKTKLTPSRNLATVLWVCGSVINESIAFTTPQFIARELPAIRRKKWPVNGRQPARWRVGKRKRVSRPK